MLFGSFYENGMVILMGLNKFAPPIFIVFSQYDEKLMEINWNKGWRVVREKKKNGCGNVCKLLAAADACIYAD